MSYKSLLRHFLLCLLYLIVINSNSQEFVDITVKNSSFATTGSNLPFWFHANQHGKINSFNQFLNVLDVNFEQIIINNEDKKVGWIWGGNLIAGVGNENYFQLNQAFMGITYGGWELKGGMYHDPLYYSGLSSTNGNLVRSGNAKPFPNIRLSNIDYKPVPFFSNWLQFKFEFDEGLLNDERYVNEAHMHHKSLYLLINPKRSWDFRFGLEHYVMWGGTSSSNEIGQLPMKFNDYIRSVLGLSGSEDSPLNEKLNKQGNHLGTYQFEYIKHLAKLNLSIYLSHPFENHPGLEWRNWQDNLIGIHILLDDKTKFVTNILYECTNTRQQNKKETNINGLIESYFTNSIYRSGFTYNKRVIGSPLFFPVYDENSESDTENYGVRSNRFLSHHIGLKGNITKYIKWKGLMTHIQHFGSYGKPYDFPQKQLSGLVEFHYVNSNLPIEISLSCGLDTGNYIDSNTGIALSFIKRW